MHWKNDGTPAKPLTIPEGFTVVTLPECRGKGVGKMLGNTGEYVLKITGMQTATLKTDDFRVPAIKAYLSVGFQPDLSTGDFVQRWDAIYKSIGLKK